MRMAGTALIPAILIVFIFFFRKNQQNIRVFIPTGNEPGVKLTWASGSGDLDLLNYSKTSKKKGALTWLRKYHWQEWAIKNGLG